MKKLYLNQWIIVSFLFFSLFSHNAISSYELGLERLKQNDVEGALSIWTRMADNGDVNSQYSVGVLYEQQSEYISHEKSVYYLELASQQGMHKAQYHLAMKYFSGYGVTQDFKKTIQLLLKAAAQDYPEAQYQLGRMASDGLGFQQDVTEAIRWYMLAAENGFGPAQHTLASHYMTGNGTVANVDKAVIWLNHAAEQNNMLAQRDLGFLYTQGMGVEKSYAKAAELLLNPATEGSPVSRYILGQIYAEGGYGLERSIRSAKHWFSEAMKVGYPKAASALEQISHIPSEPEEVVQETTEPEQEEYESELVEMVDPNSHELDNQYYNFYNEDISAFRNTTKENTSNIGSDDWEYIDEETLIENMDEDSLVEYDNIDQEFDDAFAREARSIGGSRSYKRLFGMYSDKDYRLRKDRSFVPEFSEEDSSSKALAYRSTRSGQHKQLSFFSRNDELQESSTQNQESLTQNQESSSNNKDASTSNKASSGIELQNRYSASALPLKNNSELQNSVSQVSASDTYSTSQAFQGDSERFVKLAGDSFTLQVLQSTSLDQAQQLTQKNGDFYILPTNRNNRPLYLVTYGSYSDRQEAEAAAQSLPQYVSMGTPWIRKVSKVQRQIQKL